MVNPISFPQYNIDSRVDFSPLAKLPEIMQQAQARQVLGNLQRKADGSFDTSALFASGDMNLARLGMELERNKSMEGRDARDFQFRQTEAQRAQQNAERGFGLQERTATRLEDRTPAGYEPSPEQPGAVRPLVGGPQDPATLARRADEEARLKVEGTNRLADAALLRRQQAAVAQGLVPGTPQFQQYVLTETLTTPKAKELPSGVVKDMGEKGGMLEDFTRLNTGFKDEYGGFKTEFAGDVANTIASKTGYLNPERADWWRDYQTQKNTVRNKLFGSALTAPEKAEFDKANINPSMTPASIKANLKLQHDASRRAAAKLANTYTRMGYSQDQIEAAIGLPLADLQPPPAKEGRAPLPSNTTRSGVTWSVE